MIDHTVYKKTSFKEFWMKRLESDAPKASFSYNSEKLRGCSHQLNFTLTNDQYITLSKLSNNSDYTLHIVLLTSITVLLNKYSNLDDLIISTPIYRQETEGDYINTILPIKSTINNTITLKQLLLYTKDYVTEAINYQDYPLDIMLYNLGHEKTEAENPLFDAAVALKNIHDELYLRDVKVSIKFIFERKEDNISLQIVFDPCKYSEKRIEQIYNHLQVIFNNLYDNLDKTVASICVYSEEEKHQLINIFNSTAKDLDTKKTFSYLFKEQVVKTPLNIAVGYNQDELTYKELYERSAQLSQFLKKKGVGLNSKVSVYMPRGIDMLVSIIAILEAGAVYVPIDTDYPNERTKSIVNDSETEIILTSRKEHAKIKDVIDEMPKTIDLVCVEERSHKEVVVTEISTSRNVDDLAYMIYTSGTTGKPKGVMIHQLGMINHLYAKINELNLEEKDVIAQTASPCFDISIWQFLSGLIIGAKTQIVDKEKTLEPSLLVDEIKYGKITILESVPSLIVMFLDGLKECDRKILDQLKWMILTGEPLSVALANKWCSYFPNIRLLNAYGPTEASDDVTHYIVEKPSRNQESIPIGKPIQNTHIYILDKYNNLCPIGIQGEICVAGLGVGKGYWKDEEKTNKAFILNPFLNDLENKSYTKIYKTGDIGYYLEDGNVVCLGRVDEQVKIRGNRIELGEIENSLTKYDNIDLAKVIINNDKSTAYLVVYYSSKSEIDITELRHFLSNRLPEYMIPDFFVHLKKFTLTPNGKIDRKALPDYELKIKNNYVPPGNEIQKELVEIWAEVLKIDKDIVSINSIFFELGGHSIKAIQLIDKIREKFSVRIELKRIFEYPTIESLSGFLITQKAEGLASIKRAEKREYYPASFAQERLYHEHILNKDLLIGNISRIFKIEGDVDIARLRNTFQSLIKRHDALRTSFTLSSNYVIQRIHNDICNSLYNINEKEKVYSNYKDAFHDFVQPFNLSETPLMRCGLYQDVIGDKYLFFDIHHIICDGISLSILINEFQSILTENNLPAPELNYVDFTCWQKLKNRTLEKQKEFWMKHLSGTLPRINLPTIQDRDSVKINSGGKRPFVIKDEEFKKIKELALKSNVSNFIFLLSTYYIFLSKVSGDNSILVGTDVIGRTHGSLKNVIGTFVNALPLKIEVDKHASFKEFLLKIKNHVVEAFENQDFQYDQMVASLNLGLEEKLVDIYFSYVNFFDDDQETNKFKFVPVHIEKPTITTRFELHLNITEDIEQLVLTFIYSNVLYDDDTIDLLIDYFNKTLSHILEDIDIEIEDIKLDDSINYNTLEYLN